MIIIWYKGVHALLMNCKSCKNLMTDARVRVSDLRVAFGHSDSEGAAHLFVGDFAGVVHVEP